MSEAVPERSRRSLLAGLFGGAVAFVASSLGRPQTASAAGNVINGADNAIQTHRTLLHNNHANVSDPAHDEDVDALFGYAENNGAGVAGQSTGGPGVKGYSGPIPMPDTLSLPVGVYGESALANGFQSFGVYGVGRIGVYGEGEGTSSAGLQGYSDSGVGLLANTHSGIAVYAIADTSASGYALSTWGRVRLEFISGVATIPVNKTSVIVQLPTLVTGESFVLLTAKANIGKRSLWFTTDTTNNRITIHVSSVYSTSKTLPIAWVCLN